MKSTKSQYFDGENYLPIRKKLHNKIIQNTLKNFPNQIKEPIAYLLGGGSASGKSTYGEHYKLLLNKQNRFPVYIDCDQIKDRIPEYRLLKTSNPLMATYIVHDESSDIANEVLMQAVLGNYDIIFDGTMKNEKKYISLISTLKKNGYEVFAIIVDVPLEYAFKMAELRFQIDGRAVNETIILDTHKGVSRTFNNIKDLFDGYVLWDNSNYNDKGTIFAEKNDEGEYIYNKERLQQFYLKGSIT